MLLFTSQPLLAQQLAKTTGESERIDQEVEVCITVSHCCVLLSIVKVSIFGVGLSLVNNDRAVRRELVIFILCSRTVVCTAVRRRTSHLRVATSCGSVGGRANSATRA